MPLAVSVQAKITRLPRTCLSHLGFGTMDARSLTALENLKNGFEKTIYW